VDTGKVHGIGIGIPGSSTRDEHRSLAGGPFGRRPFDLRFYPWYFRGKIWHPHARDNDANAAVFGEEWYGKGLGVQNAIYLYSGSGCGFMINGQIYRGATGCAARMAFRPQNGGSARNGARVVQVGRVEPGPGIARTAQAAQKEDPQSKIFSLAKGKESRVTVLTVAKAAEAGDALANRLLKEAGLRLGRKAAFLVNLFNPDVIVVGGGIEAAGAAFLDGVREAVKQMAIPEATDKLRVIPSALGENGVSLGAAAFVAQNYFVSV